MGVPTVVQVTDMVAVPLTLPGVADVPPCIPQVEAGLPWSAATATEPPSARLAQLCRHPVLVPEKIRDSHPFHSLLCQCLFGQTTGWQF